MNNIAYSIERFNITYKFARPEIPDFMRTLVPYGATYTTSAENMLLAFKTIRMFGKGLTNSLYTSRCVRIYKTTLHGVYVAEFCRYDDYRGYTRACLVDAQTIIDTYIDNLDNVVYNNSDIADVTGVSELVFRRI